MSYIDWTLEFHIGFGLSIYIEKLVKTPNYIIYFINVLIFLILLHKIKCNLIKFYKNNK